jgi:hypothetical protein
MTGAELELGGRMTMLDDLGGEAAPKQKPNSALQPVPQ